jgi:hypothetical protein
MSVRWTANRKRGLIEDIRSGTVGLRAALEAHDISVDEYLEWVRAYDEHGKEALKSTKLQQFRAIPRRPRRRRVCVPC